MNQKNVSEYRNMRLTPYQGLIWKNWGYLSGLSNCCQLYIKSATTLDFYMTPHRNHSNSCVKMPKG